MAEELIAELSTALLVDDVEPAGKLNEVRINEINLDVASQSRQEELDIVADSGTVPAVIVSNLVNYVPASVSSPVKQSVYTC